MATDLPTRKATIELMNEFWEADTKQRFQDCENFGLAHIQCKISSPEELACTLEVPSP